MDILNRVVALMGRKEVKNFKIYAGRAWQGEHRKDIHLFDFIREKAENYSDEEAFRRLYKHDSKNAFYRIKNRLLDDINTSIFLQEYSENDTMLAFFWSALGHYYHSKNEYKLALYYFKKAERKAVTAENYGLLDIIYARLIRISQEVLTENPGEYLDKRKQNRNLLNKMSDLDDVVDAVEYRMKISQNISSSDSLQELLKITIDDYTNDEELKGSNKLQIRLYQVVSRILLQKKDYASLEKYLTDTYKLLSRKNFFTKANHSIKLDMISWLANTYCANKKYKKSLEYAELLRQEMEKFNRAFYERFEFFYINILVTNYSAINPEKALEILLELTQKNKMDKLSINGVFVYTNLVLLYYQKQDYKNALKYITKTYTYKDYTSSDALFKLQINFGELMMRIDTGDMDTADYRLKQVSKFVSSIPVHSLLGWEKDFLDALAVIIQHPDYKSKNNLNNKMKKAQKSMDGMVEDEGLFFPFRQWLKDKN